MAEQLIPLTQLPRELSALTGAQAPGYRRLYGLVLDGRLPTEHRNGRHYLPRERLPEVAALVGMTASTDATRPVAA